MPQASLEERVSRLEQIIDRLLQPPSASAEPRRDDWKTTFGMFARDSIMKEIIEAGQRIREDDRAQTRQ
jgi:hypothetical protein